MFKPSEHETYFDIFPLINRNELPLILQSSRLKEEVLADIHNDADTLSLYQSLSTIAKQQFLDFCIGNRGLQITYDPFFKKIFNQDRLERLISCILEQEIKIVEILPRDSYKSSAEGSFLIMDVIVRLFDGSIVDVEIQRVTHNFPIQRAVCYASDVLMRQYDLLKSEHGAKFSYADLRPVYVIVLMESAAGKFNEFPDTYLHRSSPEIHFKSGLIEKNLHQFVFVSLDIFRKIPHNEINELEAWLYFLSSDNPRDIARLIAKYPEFTTAYQEIIQFRFHPKEMLLMVSDAIKIMDNNAVKSMVEEMKDKIQEQCELIASKDEQLASKDEQLASKDEQLAQYAEMIKKLGGKLPGINYE